MIRSLLLSVLCVALIPWVSACGSTGSGAAGSSEGTRIVYRGQGGIVLTIVDDAWILAQGFEGESATLRRAAFYSEKREQATTKVATDEQVAGLVQYLRDEGFRRFSREGPGTSAGGSSITIAVGDDTRHLGFAKDRPADELRAYQRCWTVFMDVYNTLESYQSADPDRIRLEGATGPAQGAIGSRPGARSPRR